MNERPFRPVPTSTSTQFRVPEITQLLPRVQVIFEDGSACFSSVAAADVQTNLDTEEAERKAADTAIHTRITNLPDTENRVIAVSNWEDGADARTVYVSIYPPKPIPANTTLNFTVEGLVVSVASGGDPIDLQGAVIALPIAAADALVINRKAKDTGFAVVNWTYNGTTYHCYLDFISAAGGSLSEVLTTVGPLIWEATPIVRGYQQVRGGRTLELRHNFAFAHYGSCLLYTSPSPRDS